MSDVLPAELMTLREVASLCRVSERTLWGWAHDGTSPPPIRIGKGTTRYSRRAYEEWIADRCPRLSAGPEKTVDNMATQG